MQLLLNAAEVAHDATILKICEAESDFSFNLNVKSMHRMILAFRLGSAEEIAALALCQRRVAHIIER